MPFSLHLLTLPLEIRSQIYFLVLTSPPSSCNPSMRRKRVPKHFFYSYYLPCHPPTSSSLALLLTNNQIHRELSALLSSRSAPSSTLSLILEAGNSQKRHNKQITPTWTSVPSLPITYARRLFVEVVPWCEVKKTPCSFYFSRGYMGHVLLNLLSRFFGYGPTFLQKDASRAKKPTYIEELVVDVLPVEDVEGAEKKKHFENLMSAKPQDPEIAAKVPQVEVFEEMRRLLGRLARSGIVGGKVERILLMKSGVVGGKWEVERREEGRKWEWASFGWIAGS